jgi:hypothetical protein
MIRVAAGVVAVILVFVIIAMAQRKRAIKR